MPDVSELGIKVTLENGQVVAQQLDKIATAGANAEASTKKLTGSTDGLTASQRFLAAQGVSLDAVMNRVNGTSSTLALNTNAVTEAVTEEAVAHETAAASAGIHGLQLGRLNMELGTFIGRMTGANTAATRLSGQIGGAVVGYGAMIAVLASIAAGLEIYKAWTEGTSKAKEEQDKLTESLTKWYEKQKEGAAGEFPKQIDAMTKKVKELREELDKLNAGSVSGAASAVGAGGSKFSAWLRIFTAGDFVAMVNQAHTEIVNGAGKIAGDIKTGDAAIAAAQDEVSKRLEAEADKKLKARLAAILAENEASQVAIPAEVAAQEKQLDVLRKVNEQNNIEALQTANAIALKHADADVREILANHQRAELDRLKAYHDLSGIALTDRLAAIDAIEKQNDALLKKEQTDKRALDMMKQVSEIGAKNKAIADAGLKQASDSITKQNKFDEQMRKDWLSAIDQMTENGLKSFTTFFKEVQRLFTKLMTDMEKAGKDSGFGYRLLGLGSSAISGGFAGYNIGQQTGNGVTGALGGAAAGAAAGGQIAGPWGAAIGGLVGAGAGLLGAASAQKQAAEAQRQASQAAYVSLLQLNVQAGTSSPRALAVVQAHDAANALADAIDKALPGLKNQTEREKELAQVRADEVIIVAKLNAAAAEEIKQGDASVEARRLYALGLKVEGDALTRRMAEEKEVFDAQQAGWSAARIAALQAVQALEDLAAAAQAFAAQVAANLSSQQNSQLRIFNATGQSDAAFAMQQQLELDQAIAQGLDDISIALLKQAQGAELAQREQQKQTDALNKQVSASQDQLRTAEQSLAALQQIHDNLQAFGASLKLGQFSTLSPAQQLAEARNQVTSAYQKALGGDQAAAQQFPSLAQSFLQSSRGYNASGAGYVMDFNSVSVMTDALTQAFGDQMTDQEKVIKALKDQIDLLTKQLAELEGINKGVGDLAQIAMRNFDPTANLPPGIGVDNPHVPNPDPVGTPRPSGPGPSPGTPVTPSNPGRPAIGTPSSSDFAVAVLQDGFSQLIDQVSSLATSQADLARETRIGFQALRAS